ncbi:hypothetical protein J19TS2_55590 [Cohnella xylanilytica]|uniref:FAD-dependent oxidoreductase n=1 Tax=Cohnella xylanilytica TaxID=557555 RepID=A0A841TPY5_9BACL|nr:FAD-dependent oxidoreductase [Cohnella xylanilytica]MBB6690387.1 FAD-dependent oxidoreductase [Cohnella xylanilytica]GIO16004.1 hypothetical protein J19TS2_55590 [Cohnella xylanilytica]
MTVLAKRGIALGMAFLLLFSLLAAGCDFAAPADPAVDPPARKPLAAVESASRIEPEYDVIVAGTDPEGITAAVSAARNGLRVLLLEARDRRMLGGLLTEGGLNSLDLNRAPGDPKAFLNKGLFQEWYDKVEGTSFDLVTGANAFYEMVKAEPNIDLRMGVKNWKPIAKKQNGRIRVTGMEWTGPDGAAMTVPAAAVIDATQDGDIYAMAGADFTVGREDVGDKSSLMASTLVIRMSGVTDRIWNEMKKRSGMGADELGIWGYVEAKDYPSTDPNRIKMRGLNIGRQNDGTILINAMQLFGVDPLDPRSVERGLEDAKKEAPLIAEFLRKKFPAMKDLEYAGTADELYTRESRHLIGEYRLTTADVVENRTHWDDIAYGSYPVDIQSTNTGGAGTILMHPKQYGVPFRCLVPAGTDGLLVVGRSASFDSIPHGSARVVPLGMATGQAAGAAVKIALKHQISFAEMSRSRERIAELQDTLTKQGMDLKPRIVPTPKYMKHKQYKGLLFAAGTLFVSGGFENDWKLNDRSNLQRFHNMVRAMMTLRPDRFRGDLTGLLNAYKNPRKMPLSLGDAAFILAKAALDDDGITNENALEELVSRGWITGEALDTISNRDHLTNGDQYMLLRDLMEKGLGARPADRDSA